MPKFDGFLPETIDFLWELRMNNSKEWMDQNRERYKAVLKEPFERLAADAAKMLMKATGEELDWAISRINRDIRYSKDKSPYRACRWVVFKEPTTVGTAWKTHPAFYFELTPEGYTHGMGFYETTPTFIKAFREKIKAKPAAFAGIIGKIEKQSKFLLMGEDYKKVDFEGLPPEVYPWYAKKNFALIETKKLEEILFSGGLPQILTEEWKSLIPLYRFLKEIKAQ